MSPRSKAVALSALTLAALVLVASQFRMSTDLSLFLPEPESRFDRLLRHQLDHGASSDIIFIAFSGAAPEALAEFNMAMAGALRESERFSSVNNNASALGDGALDFLAQHRYLLTHNDLSRQFSVDGLKQSLAQRLDGLASTSSALEKKYLRNDPTGETLSLLEEWQGKISRHKTPTERFAVWFSSDLSRSLLMVEIAAEISSLHSQEDAVAEVRRVYRELEQPGIRMILTGPAAFAMESGEEIRDDMRLLTLIAAVLVLPFLWSVYRSVRTVALVAAPLAAGVVVATAAMLLIYGEVHGITLAFGVTLAGVAIDYPIHLLSALGLPVRQREHKIKRIWRTLRLGVLSTVVAYTAFLMSGFRGLEQLGMFTITGLFTAAVFARWVLPRLVTARARDEHGLESMHGFLRRMAQRARALGRLAPGVLVLALLALVISERPVLHLNVDSLSPISDQRRAEGRMLRDDLGFWYGGSMFIVTAGNKEQVLRLSEQLQPELDELVQGGVIEGYDMAAHLLPSMQRQELRKAQARAAGDLQGNLDRAVAEFPFKPGIFEPFIRDVRDVAQLAPLDADHLERTPIGRKLDPLLFDLGGESAGVALLHGVSDAAAVEAFADGRDGVYYLHLKSASTDLMARSVNRVALVMVFCVLVIYLALAWGFRNFMRPFRIMVPAFAAAAATAAILVFTGHPLSVFHLVSLLLVIGLGLDYALFFNRLPENNDEWDTTFRALWICAVTTILVFGILFFSRTPPLKAIGLTVGVGALLSILLAATWSAASSATPSAARREEG